MREKQIGEYIARKRRERGLTQDALGEKLGVTGKAISKWERGLSLPDVDMIHTMSSILLCRAENILNGQDDPHLSSEKNSGSDSNLSADEKTTDVDTISLTDLDYEVSPLLFGGNIEHTRSAVNGGLSAQMLRNRKFAGMPNSARGNAAEWFVIGDKTFCMVGSDRADCDTSDPSHLVTPYTSHSPLGYHMHRRYERNAQLLQNLYGEESGLGQHALAIKGGEIYDFRIVLRTDAAAKLTVSLTSHDGRSIYARNDVMIEGNTWQTYSSALTPDTTNLDATLRITLCDKARLVIGAVSLMPRDNFHGMRSDVVARLKEMNIKLLRWPGGNFAGEYNWLDGLLPVDMRSPLKSHILHLTQPHTFGYDFHEIDTDDFLALCQHVGAEPSITLNMVWCTPEENAAWVEYCNGDESTKFGKMRAERGHPAPYGVKYWSLGNEAGYGHMEGDNSPSGYRRIAEENARAMLKIDPSLILCSSGFHPSDEWGDGACNRLADLAPMAALHNYVNSPTYADSSIKKQELASCLLGVEICREKIHHMRSYLSDKISIAFDEWNCWYSWYRPKDVFGGIFASKMFCMFIEEQKISNVTLSAIFQPINEGCIAIYPDHSELTPMGKAFDALSRHSEGKVLYSAPNAVVTKRNGVITATVINDSIDTSRSFILECNGKASGYTLTADDIGPYTDFDRIDANIDVRDGAISLIAPPLSITQVEIK